MRLGDDVGSVEELWLPVASVMSGDGRNSNVRPLSCSFD